MEESILIIDDEEEVLRVLSRYFSSHGYTVLTAFSSSEGFQIAYTRPIHLLFLDLLLVEQDGWETLRGFHDQFPALPIVVMTGLNLHEDDVADVLRSGARRCFAKSEQLTNVLRAAKELTEQSQTRSEAPYA